jgi:hypothetical protein
MTIAKSDAAIPQSINFLFAVLDFTSTAMRE